MKPANFPNRKLRRQALALQRMPRGYDGKATKRYSCTTGAHHHEMFVLYGALGPGLYKVLQYPTDIKLRIGAAGRKL